MQRPKTMVLVDSEDLEEMKEAINTMKKLLETALDNIEESNKLIKGYRDCFEK